MNSLEILLHDVKYNQDGLSLEEAIENYQEKLQEGFRPLLNNNTIFLIKAEDNVVCYHSINAAPKQTYINNIYSLIELLRLQGYKAAYTTLTNPKLRAFVKRYFKDSIIVDDNSIMFLN
mgnify:CR=1 FL=1